MALLKTNYGIERKFEAFYTSGRIQVSSDGQKFYCNLNSKVQVVDISTGQIVKSMGEEEDEEITEFCLSPDNTAIVLASRNLLLRQWDVQGQQLVRSWKAIHTAPVVTMAFDVSSTLLATGSADSTIKLWDIIKQHCTHNLKGHHGVISALAFHPDPEKLQLFSAGDDYKVRVWNLVTSSCIASVEAHVSTVTSFCFSNDRKTLFSGGRDNTIAVWNLHKLNVIKTIPVFESVESIVPMPDHFEEVTKDVNVRQESCILVAGTKGVIKVWDTDRSKCLYTKDMHCTDDQGIVQLVHMPSTQTLAVVMADRNITLLDANNCSVTKQFCGFMDEVLDLQFVGDDDSHVVMATNSEDIKLFELSTWNCHIIKGHTDIVLNICIHKKHHLVGTSSKDNTVRVWRFNEGKLTCIAEGKGHTKAVGALAFSTLSSSILISGGQDLTLKLWDLSSLNENSSQVTTLHSIATEIGHEKDINSVTIAPNDKFVATGSQDRTLKLWSANDLSLLGVMRGHRRGIWCVQFSPVDQCVASSSADGTIKIWSLTDFSCVKTFEGHDSSVLKVVFISRGMQLLSCGSDGLVKLWTIRTNVCEKTFDEHEEKLWALTVNKDEKKILTGGADSKVVLWKDITEEEKDESFKKQEEFIMQEQQLSNLIQQKKFLKAISVAIVLEQPFKVLKIMKEILTQENGREELIDTLSKLRPDQIDTILRFSVHWNTNSRHCHEAQLVLNTVLKSYTLEELQKFPNIKSTVEALIPYTERHFQRMNRLLEQTAMLEYTYHCMRGLTDKPMLRLGNTHEVQMSNTVPIETDSGEVSHESESETNVEEVSMIVNVSSEDIMRSPPSDKENSQKKKVLALRKRKVKSEEVISSKKKKSGGKIAQGKSLKTKSKTDKKKIQDRKNTKKIKS